MIKTLNISYERRLFKQMELSKKRAEKDLGKKISWAAFIYGRVLAL